MGPIGIPEMMAIFVIALLLFGPKKLPELGRTLGKALSEFRRAKNELKSTFETHLQELERETRIDLSTPKLEPPSYTPSSYTYPYDDSYTYGSTSSPYAEETAPHETTEPALVPPVVQPAHGTVPRSNAVNSATQETAAPTENHPA